MHSHPLPPFDPWLWWQACQQTWMASLDPGGMGRQLRQVRLDRLLAGRVVAATHERASNAHSQPLRDFDTFRRPACWLTSSPSADGN